MQQQAVTEFKARLRGELIEPGSAGYQEARKVHNAMISRKPCLIAKCADVADVMTSINFGRQNGLRVSIRSGGHNAGGLGVCDDGLVIDLSRSTTFVSIPLQRQCEWVAVAPGALSTTPPTHLDLPCPPESSPPPALAARPSAAAWDTSL